MPRKISEDQTHKQMITPLSLQEELASVVAWVEQTQLASLGDFVRSRQGESERQVNGLFESLLVESFGG